MGDLGCSDSSGFVGSSKLSSSTSPSLSTKFQLNIPCTNFPTSVSSDSYRTGLGSISSSHHPEEDDFSEDSLLEYESPGKRKRVTKRLAELAQQIDCDDSLANIDSLKSRNDDNNIKPQPSLGMIDSLNPAMSMSTTTLVSEVDSLELSPATSSRHDLQKKINVINAQIKDIETRQLLNELESLEKEILSVSLRQQQQESSSRSRWTVTDIEIACDDLTDNNVMTYSYENVGSLLGSSRRDSIVSNSTITTPTVSVCDIDISEDPPLPQKATLPSPIPNLTKFNFKKPTPKPSVRPMVSHTGAVGVTSMWIPASNSSDCLSSSSSSTGPVAAAVRPKIQSKSPNANSNTTNKSAQRTNIRDNGAIGKKLQIQSILPNKHKAEGSKSCSIIMECCKKSPTMFVPISLDIRDGVLICPNTDLHQLAKF